jgi:hypothetical protein
MTTGMALQKEQIGLIARMDLIAPDEVHGAAVAAMGSMAATFAVGVGVHRSSAFDSIAWDKTLEQDRKVVKAFVVAAAADAGVRRRVVKAKAKRKGMERTDQERAATEAMIMRLMAPTEISEQEGEEDPAAGRDAGLGAADPPGTPPVT